MLASILNETIRYHKKLDPAVPGVHMSNHAMDTVFGSMTSDEKDGAGVFLVGSTYEDTNIAADIEAREAVYLVDVLMPNAWIIIFTGDYIMTADHYAENAEETYDPYYCVYLLHKDTYAKYRAELERIDGEWRREAMAKAQGTSSVPAVDMRAPSGK